MKGFLQFLGTYRLVELFITITFGEAIKKFLGVAVIEVAELPRVAHYIEEHGGRSVYCNICRLAHIKSFDGLS